MKDPMLYWLPDIELKSETDLLISNTDGKINSGLAGIAGKF
jgi:hypothetical protein